MDSTQESLRNYLREREDHWWKWFDNDDENEMQQKYMKDAYMQQMTRIKNDAYHYNGYISKSWLWLHVYAIEKVYTQHIKQTVWDGYVKQEIPPRAGKKMRELVEIG